MERPSDPPVDILNLGPIEKDLTALALCFAARDLWTDRETPIIGTKVFPIVEFFSEHVLVIRIP